MPNHAKIDLKLKRFEAIEAACRAAIRRAKEDLRRYPERRKRYERAIEKNRRKAERLLPKIRRLREIRASHR